MTIRITGMASGLDTESIIRELTSVDKKNVTKVKNEQKRLEMKQEKWKALNKKVVNFYNKSLSNMRFDGGYAKKSTTVSDDSVASVSGTTSAMNGTQKLSVSSVASAAYMTGGKLKSKGDSKVRLTDSSDGKESATTMADLGVTGKQKLSIKFGDGNEDKMEVEVSESDSLKDVLSRINSATSTNGNKVRVNFDENQGRLYLSSTKTGAAASFAIDGEGSDSGLVKALGLASGDDAVIKTGEKVQAPSKMYSVDRIKRLGVTAEDKLKFKVGGNEFSLDLDPEKSVNDLIASMKDLASELDISFDEDNQQFVVRNGDFEANSEVGAKFGFAKKAEDDSYVSAMTTDNSAKASYIGGADAKITLNGVEYTSDTNSFEINGLTINAKKTTGEGESVTITTQDDTSGVYDMIKGFMKEYNDLINEMATLYSADRNKDFDFLTSEQKEEMTDDEIEDWNKKIDESIMSKDQTLGKVMQAMRQSMLGSYDLTDKNGNTMKVSLSTFNINTLSYFEAEAGERYAYHIAGDEDDEYSSGKTAMSGTQLLKDAIVDDPTLVQNFFKNLSKDLYTKLGDMMKSTEFSSSYTLYEDKLMKKNYDNYKTKIKSAEDKLASREDAYYKQFAQMEKAMTNLNSQQSSLAGMIG